MRKKKSKHTDISWTYNKMEKANQIALKTNDATAKNLVQKGHKMEFY